MTVHLIKLSVGVEDVDHLAALQAGRMADARAAVKAGAEKTTRATNPWHITRNRPRREAEVLDGGSIYWVIKRVVRVRQRIVGIEETIGEDGKPRAALVLDPELVRTQALPHRAFQGWRYFEPAKAPLDIQGTAQGGEMPDELARELGNLGLL